MIAAPTATELTTGAAGDTGPTTIAIDETGSGPASSAPTIDISRWAALATAVLSEENVAGGELGLLFVGPERMAEPNREHMGSEGPTDVLAFPLDGNATGQSGSGAATLIGDVVVCPDRAGAQAAAHAGPGHNGTVEDEIALLVVHGVLHVLGYDHANENDAAVMRARERDLLAAHHRLL